VWKKGEYKFEFSSEVTYFILVSPGVLSENSKFKFRIRTSI